jgi:hypothetical protein
VILSASISPTKRDLFAGMVDHFVLIRDLKDLAVRGDQNGFVASLDAALRTARMAVGGDFGAPCFVVQPASEM